MDKKTNEEILHMVHEDRKILDNMEMSTQMVGQNAARYIRGKDIMQKTRERRRTQMVNDLIGNSICTDLKKAAEESSIWQTLRRDLHKPTESADH